MATQNGIIDKLLDRIKVLEKNAFDPDKLSIEISNNNGYLGNRICVKLKYDYKEIDSDSIAVPEYVKNEYY